MKGSTPKLTAAVERDDLREGDGLHARATRAAALTLRCLLVALLCAVASLVPASVSWGQSASSGGAAVIYEGGPQSIPNANDQRYNFSQKVYDPDGLVTTGTDWRFKAPVSGIYNLSLNVAIDFPPNDPYIHCSVFRLAKGSSQKKVVVAGRSFDVECMAVTDLVLGKDDLLFVEVGQAGGAARNVYGRIAVRLVR